MTTATAQDPELLFRATGVVRGNMSDVTRYRINNVWVDTYATVTGPDQGEQQVPGWRDKAFEVPAAHGVVDYGGNLSGPRRSYDPGLFTLGGTVLGVDPDTGQWDPGESFAVYLRRVSDLVRMFSARTLVVDAVRPDGTVRQAEGHLLGGMRISREPADPWFGRWQATVRIPGSFWVSPTPVTAATPTGGVASGSAIVLGALAECEAPIADAVLTFGPGNNPSLVQGGMFFAYDGVVPSGSFLVVDTGSDPRCGYGGNPWNPLDGNVRYNPGPSWFEIDPTGAPAATLIHTGGGLMYAAITAHPKYLTS